LRRRRLQIASVCMSIHISTALGISTSSAKHEHCQRPYVSSQCCRMLHVIASNQEQFGSEKTQQAQQQQSWVADLQAGLLSGKTFRRFLSQHCGLNSSMTQICCHQAFAQAVSGMIRCTASKALPLLLASCLSSALVCLWQCGMIACYDAVQLPQSCCSCKDSPVFFDRHVVILYPTAVWQMWLDGIVSGCYTAPSAVACTCNSSYCKCCSKHLTTIAHRYMMLGVGNRCNQLLNVYKARKRLQGMERALWDWCAWLLCMLMFAPNWAWTRSSPRLC